MITQVTETTFLVIKDNSAEFSRSLNKVIGVTASAPTIAIASFLGQRVRP